MNETKVFLCGRRPDDFGELESQVFVVEPDDIEGTTVRAWLSLHPGGAHPLVMLEAEDRDSRNRRALLPALVRGMVGALAALSRLRTTQPAPPLGLDHPGWCTRMENAGDPNRSRELTAGAPRDGDTVTIRLAHGRHHPSPHPSTFIEIQTYDDSLAWPPLTSNQHDSLIGQLTLLLDLMRLGELDQTRSVAAREASRRRDSDSREPGSAW